MVVFDPNWDPSKDLQAMDRAFRIGQTRDVEVLRLVASGTVEEQIYTRQARSSLHPPSTLYLKPNNNNNIAPRKDT